MALRFFERKLYKECVICPVEKSASSGSPVCFLSTFDPKDLRSCVILRDVVWYLLTDLSGQHIGHIFKGTDTLSRNVRKQSPLDAA